MDHSGIPVTKLPVRVSMEVITAGASYESFHLWSCIVQMKFISQENVHSGFNSPVHWVLILLPTIRNELDISQSEQLLLLALCEQKGMREHTAKEDGATRTEYCRCRSVQFFIYI